jgi:branched-subunit amino acid transport protein
MAPLLKVRGLKRILASQITIDESTAIALAHESKSEADARTGFWLTGGGIYLFWNLATLIGALGANALGDPAKWGLDATIPAAFLGLLWPRLASASSKIVAVAAHSIAHTRASDYRLCSHTFNRWMAGALMMWGAVIGASVLAFAFKYIGQSIPQSLLTNPRVARIADLIPTALLAGLVAAQTFAEKTTLVVDQRLAGLAVAAIALSLRANFLVMLIAATGTSALLHRL